MECFCFADVHFHQTSESSKWASCWMSSRRFCKAASKDSCSSFRCWQHEKNGSKKKINDCTNDETDGRGTTHIQPKYLLCICLHLVYIWHLLYVCVRLLVSFPTGNWSWWTKDFFSELLTIYNVYSLYPQCKDHPPSCIAKELHGWRHAPRLSLPESNAVQTRTSCMVFWIMVL